MVTNGDIGFDMRRNEKFTQPQQYGIILPDM